MYLSSLKPLFVFIQERVKFYYFLKTNFCYIKFCQDTILLNDKTLFQIYY